MITSHVQSTPVTEEISESSFFMVTNDMIEATTTNTKVMDDQATSDFSPCSDGFSTSFTNDDHKIDKEPNSGYSENNPHFIDDEDFQQGDIDSLDEGVGDISSDGEHPDSPTCQESNNNTIGEPVVTKCAKSDEKVSDLSLISDSDPHSSIHRVNSQTTSLVKERIPSRFSFGK